MTDFIQQAFWRCCYYLFLLLFAVGIYCANILSLLLSPFPAGFARKTLRAAVFGLLRLYLTLMTGSGALSVNLEVLDRLKRPKGGRLLIGNHPSILDAPILLGRIPGLLCVFKSSLKRSFTMARTGKVLGYLSNDEGIAMLKDLAVSLRNGEQVLLFPEGTRTEGTEPGIFNGGYALAAMRARVPVQLILIEAASPVLTKKQHFLKAARFPARFRLTLGPCIEPGTFTTVRAFNSFVEDWFRQNLPASRLSRTPFLPPGTALEAAEGVSSATFRVPDDPFYCRGHMPGNPLVPAYAQMAWVHELLGAGAPAGPSDFEYFRWKFLKPVRPGDRVRITLRQGAARSEVHIDRDGERVTQGRVSPNVREDQP